MSSLAETLEQIQCSTHGQKPCSKCVKAWQKAIVELETKIAEAEKEGRKASDVLVSYQDLAGIIARKTDAETVTKTRQMLKDIASLQRFQLAAGGIKEYPKTAERCERHHLLLCTVCSPQPPKESPKMPEMPESAEMAENIASQSTETNATEAVRPAALPTFAGFEPIALRNAALGYRVFPLDMTETKKPHIKGFPELATTDEAQIREWAKQFPNASVGLLATAKSEGVQHLFVDEDLSDELRAGYEAFAGEPFPRTRTTESRPNHRQSHWIQTEYSLSELRNIVQSVTKDKMFSVRFHNEYVAGEGSQHPKGSIYTVVDDSPARPMPDKLVDYLCSLDIRNNSAYFQAAPPPSAIPVPDLPDSETRLAEMLRKYPRFDTVTAEGEGRNDITSQFIFAVYQNEQPNDYESLLSLAKAYNEHRCSPPMPESEVIAIVKGKMGVGITGKNALSLGGAALGTAVGTAKPAQPTAEDIVKGVQEMSTEQAQEFFNGTPEPPPEPPPFVSKELAMREYKNSLAGRLGPLFLDEQLEAMTQAAFGEMPVRDALTAFDVPPELAQQVRELLFTTTNKEREARNLPGKKYAEQEVNRLIYEHLKKNGRFFNVSKGGWYVPNGCEDTPIVIGPDDSNFALLIEKYGVDVGQSDQERIGMYLGHHAIAEGTKANLSISFAYKPKTRTAYYAEQPGVTLKVTADGVTKIRNGEDGVLFTYPDNYVPWSFGDGAVKGEDWVIPKISKSLIPEPGSALYDVAFESLRLKESAMTDRQKHILLTLYIILLFLPGMNRTKIIAQLLGPTGGGKSFFFEVIGRLLIGPNFSASTLPDDVKAFDIFAMNNSFVLFDNVSTVKKEIKDALCRLATGYNAQFRKYYTDSVQVTQPAIATAALTGIVPFLNEAEHSNRSFVMSVLPRENYQSSTDLFADIDARRDEVMSEIVRRVQMVLVAVHAQRSYRPSVKLRMADAATFLLRVARHEGWEAEAQELLDTWKDEQETSSLQDDPIGEVLAFAIKENFPTKELSATEFKTELIRVAAAHGLTLGYWSNQEVNSLSRHIIKNEVTFLKKYGLMVGRDKHSKTSRFSLRPSPEQIAGCLEPRGAVEAPQGENGEEEAF